jgi:hypothetical protein
MSQKGVPRGFLSVGDLTPEQTHQRDLASYGYEQDLYKHIATSSTGAIVILSAFLERIATNPHWRQLVAVSLVAFAVSLLGVVWMQLLSVLHVSRHPDEEPSKLVVFGRTTLLVCGFGGFVVGIAALTLFGIKNL